LWIAQWTLGHSFISSAKRKPANSFELAGSVKTPSGALGCHAGLRMFSSMPASKHQLPPNLEGLIYAPGHSTQATDPRQFHGNRFGLPGIAISQKRQRRLTRLIFRNQILAMRP
jgi:hypothetical protein